MPVAKDGMRLLRRVDSGEALIAYVAEIYTFADTMATIGVRHTEALMRDGMTRKEASEAVYTTIEKACGMAKDKANEKVRRVAGVYEEATTQPKTGAFSEQL
jgi:nitrate reductase beta subunit